MAIHGLIHMFNVFNSNFILYSIFDVLPNLVLVLVKKNCLHNGHQRI